MTAATDKRQRDDIRTRQAVTSPNTSGQFRTRRALAKTLKPTVYCPPADVDNCLKRSSSQ
jgi:hypothetical protein